MTTQTHDVVSHRIGVDGLFILRVHDGRVTIRGVDGDTATARATDGESLDGLEVEPGERSLSIRARRGPHFLTFGPDFPGFGRRDRGRDRQHGKGRARDLLLEVPAGATVVVEGASADVDVQGMRGDQRYRSASGDLVVRDVRGSLTIEAVSGDVEVSADGPVAIVARSVSGDVRIAAGSMPELRATTTSGDIEITGRFDGAGPYAIESVSGDATLAPIDGGLRIESRTITGDIRSDLPSRRDDADRRRVVIVGEGGPTLTFRSTSGDLRVVAARDVPVRPARPSTAQARATAALPPTEPTVSDAPPSEPDARLDILRAVERGDIDVAEAGRRLEELDIDASAADDVAREEAEHA